MSAIERLFEAVRSRRPEFARVMDNYGHLSLKDYFETFDKNEAEPAQERSDLRDAIQAYAAPIIGRGPTLQLIEQIERNPVILSANHHGPDYLSLTAQGNIAFALALRNAPVIPVFAFGDIPLNNISYGRGVLLADGRKINIFPERVKNMLVSEAPPFERDNIIDALSKLETRFTESEKKTLEGIFKEIYLSEEVLSLGRYSDQSVLINERLWERVFSSFKDLEIPGIAYLEMEKIVSSLIHRDLRSKKSLLYQIFFDAEIRSAVLKELDGKYGCWDSFKLKSLRGRALPGDSRRAMMKGAGSMFFWGIDSKQRRIPLMLGEAGNRIFLKGISDQGEEFYTDFTPRHIIDGLDGHSLLPTLFTSFVAAAFARGLKCYGGFMQTDYLTVMKNGLVKALDSCKNSELSERVASLPTENYVTGMIFIVAEYPGGKILPAGTIEIIERGGLTSRDMERILQLTVKEANLAGLPSMYSVIYGQDEREESLGRVSVNDICEQLKGKLIII